MRPKKYQVKLTDSEKFYLRKFIKSDKSERQIIRARILLLSDEKEYDRIICDKFGVNRTTIYRIRRRYCEEGLNAALFERSRPGAPQKYTEAEEKRIIDLIKKKVDKRGKNEKQ